MSIGFSGSLASMYHVSIFTTCISLNNKAYMGKLTLIYLKPKWIESRIAYSPFMVSLERCSINFYTPDDPFNQPCVANECKFECF